MEIQVNEPKSLLPSVIMSLCFEQSVFSRLQALEIVLNSLEQDRADEIGATKFKQWLNKYFLSNLDFMRKLKLHSQIQTNPELCFEYNSIDFDSHPEFKFDKLFEKELQSLNSQINKFVGILLREAQKGETVEI
jgi:hypothetical protein